jgi:hypothetical protein
MGMPVDELTLQETAEFGDVIGDRILPGRLRYVGDTHLFELSETPDKTYAHTLAHRINPGNDRFALKADRPILPGEFRRQQKGDDDLVARFEKIPVLCPDEGSPLAEVFAFSVSPSPGLATNVSGKLAV